MRCAGRVLARTDAQAEGHVLEDRHVAEQRVVLEDEADAPVAHAARAEIFTIELHGPRVGRLQAGDDAQQRRLARARRTEQRDQPAARNVEIDRVERGKAAETFCEILRTAMLMRASPSRLRPSIRRDS